MAEGPRVSADVHVTWLKRALQEPHFQTLYAMAAARKFR